VSKLRLAEEPLAAVGSLREYRRGDESLVKAAPGKIAEVVRPARNLPTH
jgi:hypothetical protein